LHRAHSRTCKATLRGFFALLENPHEHWRFATPMRANATACASRMQALRERSRERVAPHVLFLSMPKKF
jgi:hypothetical protein